MAIFYSLCYCLPETVIFETEEVHRKLVGRVSIPTSSCLSSSWIHVGALRFETSARYLHDLIGTWRSWFVSHRIRMCAIYGLPFTINIPQMLAYIPYMDPSWVICLVKFSRSKTSKKNFRALASPMMERCPIINHRCSHLGIFQHHPIFVGSRGHRNIEVIETSSHHLWWQNFGSLV